MRESVGRQSQGPTSWLWMQEQLALGRTSSSVAFRQNHGSHAAKNKRLWFIDCPQAPPSTQHCG